MAMFYRLSKKTRAEALTRVMRTHPPQLRFTQGMSDAAKKLETEKDKEIQ